MDAEADAVMSRPPREATTAVPRRMSEEEHRAGAIIRVSAEGLACTKAICNYIVDTYGRFPGGTDAMHLMWVMQAHHIDTDYYDQFFGPGAYGPTHALHLDSKVVGCAPCWQKSGVTNERRQMRALRD